MLLHSPCQIWQSDITYIEVEGQFYYAVLIIDIYTKKIVGYAVSKSLRAEAIIRALTMALKDNKSPAIHHSDKGSQYIYKEYIKMLTQNNTKISMCDTAMDNAYAERINQTIKNEYLQYWQIRTFEQLRRQVAKAVKPKSCIRIREPGGIRRRRTAKLHSTG